MNINRAADIIQSKRVIGKTGKTVIECTSVFTSNEEDGGLKTIINTNLCTQKQVDKFVEDINTIEDLTGEDIRKMLNKVSISYVIYGNIENKFVPEKGGYFTAIVDYYVKSEDYRVVGIEPIKEIELTAPDLRGLIGYKK